MGTNKYWAAAIMDFHPAFGCYFANGEAWTHAAGGAVYLFFKEKPQPACRMATLQEFIAEPMKPSAREIAPGSPAPLSFTPTCSKLFPQLEAAPEAPALAGS